MNDFQNKARQVGALFSTHGQSIGVTPLSLQQATEEKEVGGYCDACLQYFSNHDHCNLDDVPFPAQLCLRCLHNAALLYFGFAPKEKNELQTLADKLAETADNTGCSEDLMVVDSGALDALLKKIKDP